MLLPNKYNISAYIKLLNWYWIITKLLGFNLNARNDILANDTKFLCLVLCQHLLIGNFQDQQQGSVVY